MSMTGFARAEGAHGASRWVWEARSVNGRGLDIRMRVPPGLEFAEADARKRITARFQRGSLQISLQLSRDAEASARLQVNAAALATVIQAIKDLQGELDCTAPRPEGVLALRGVLETVDGQEDEAEQTARAEALALSFEALLSDLAAERGAEGARLEAVLSDQINTIATLTSQAQSHSALRPEAMADKLREQVAALLAASDQLDPGRLEQEVALLLVKSDISEELDRLTGHIAAARDLLAADDAIGRRLDFLAQEFNREANTLCAKASDPDLKRLGLEMKVVIDQFREQVQNIE